MSSQRPSLRPLPKRPKWKPVTIITGGTGAVAANASLRAFYVDGTQDYIKGRVQLERWCGNPTQFRIVYTGFDGHTGQAQVNGIVDLPRSAWNPDVNKGKSKNMTGRVLIMAFNGNDTSRGLEKVQLTIPTKNGGHSVARTMIQAFIAADIELASGDNLMGQHI